MTISLEKPVCFPGPEPMEKRTMANPTITISPASLVKLLIPVIIAIGGTGLAAYVKLGQLAQTIEWNGERIKSLENKFDATIESRYRRSDAERDFGNVSARLSQIEDRLKKLENK